MLSTKERIKKMKQAHQGPKITYAKHQEFPKEVKEKVKKSGSALKKIITIFAFIGVSVAYAGHDIKNPGSITVGLMNNEVVQQKVISDNINEIVELKTEQLQKQILSNVDSLQRLITHAKKTGIKNKNKVVKTILDEVFPRGGLPGTTHYCVAGAAKARMMCEDTTLNAIMPDPAKLPKEYGFSSSPNVSCPFMRQYFKDTLGENYAQRGDDNFNNVVNSLEAGDVITVRSARNSSSGEHCVTVAGPIQDDGTIPVMSLNTEDNYNVSPKQIVGAAKVIAQYRERLADTLKIQYEEQYDLKIQKALADSQITAPEIDTVLMLNQIAYNR